MEIGEPSTAATGESEGREARLFFALAIPQGLVLAAGATAQLRVSGEQGFLAILPVKLGVRNGDMVYFRLEDPTLAPDDRLTAELVTERKTLRLFRACPLSTYVSAGPPEPACGAEVMEPLIRSRPRAARS